MITAVISNRAKTGSDLVRVHATKVPAVLQLQQCPQSSKQLVTSIMKSVENEKTSNKSILATQYKLSYSLLSSSIKTHHLQSNISLFSKLRIKKKTNCNFWQCSNCREFKRLHKSHMVFLILSFENEDMLLWVWCVFIELDSIVHGCLSSISSTIYHIYLKIIYLLGIK